VAAALVDATAAAFGKIHLLANNAGMFPRVSFFGMTDACALKKPAFK
jgi:NAD(P)-dependent dehydrogenase (short-subunit alcohol dehydrogenase family)